MILDRILACWANRHAHGKGQSASIIFTSRTNLLSILQVTAPRHFIGKQNNQSNTMYFECILFLPFFCSFADEYKHILQAAGQLLAPLGLSFLKFSLSLRYYSPRVELFNKVSYDKRML